MLSSKHDEVWPSYESAVFMEKKLTETGFPYPHKHIAYEHMSHVKQWKMLQLIPFAIPVSAVIGGLYWGIRVLS